MSEVVEFSQPLTLEQVAGLKEQFLTYDLTWEGFQACEPKAQAERALEMLGVVSSTFPTQVQHKCTNVEDGMPVCFVGTTLFVMGGEPEVYCDPRIHPTCHGGVAKLLAAHTSANGGFPEALRLHRETVLVLATAQAMADAKVNWGGAISGAFTAFGVIERRVADWETSNVITLG